MMSCSAMGLKKGPWSLEEDSKLVASVSAHGVGRWNSIAQSAGLQRSGKSCRLRWLNYLRPNVRHGGFTLEEQLLILQLHFRWGNRWAKIAEELPGRTDNDIKNYWRTRVLKQARNLNCDVNSRVFKEAIHDIWIPRIVDRIKFGSGSHSTGHIDRIYDDFPASECVGQIQAQKIVDGPEVGPVGVEPNPFEWGDNQSPEGVINDEDVSYLRTLLFDETLNK